jgi:DNA-binding transcriptional LysR family regulator
LTLDALLDDSSLSRVAPRLGLTQPALSARLARLRILFADRLFVPAGSGRSLIATERAIAMKPAVADVIARMRELLAAPYDFDPATSNRTFVIATHENPAAMLAPDLVPRLLEIAPGVRIAFVIPDPVARPSILQDGAYDLFIGDGAGMDADLKSRTLFDEDLLSAQRRDHPRGRGPLDLDEFCALGHLLVSADGGGFDGSVDAALAAIGRNRRVSVSVQNYALAPLVLARSDLICTLPRRFLQHFRETVDMFDPPLHLGRFTLTAFWHARSQDDPSHMWLRRHVFDAAAAFGRASSSLPKLNAGAKGGDAEISG